MQRHATARARYLANAMYLSRIPSTERSRPQLQSCLLYHSNHKCFILLSLRSRCLVLHLIQTINFTRHRPSLPIRPNSVSVPSAHLDCCIGHSLLCAIFPLLSVSTSDYVLPSSAALHPTDIHVSASALWPIAHRINHTISSLTYSHSYYVTIWYSPPPSFLQPSVSYDQYHLVAFNVSAPFT
jgi:hypothetical protein